MRFFEAGELNDASQARLDAYDRFVREKVGPAYGYPLRLRDWELDQVLQRLPALPGAPTAGAMIDIGSFNTYLGLWLARLARRVVAGDLYGARLKRSLLRRFGLMPPKPLEAPYFTWKRTMRRGAAQVELESLDVTRLPYADATFEVVTCISVIEHIPDVERAVAEMYRCLVPGGRLLITTDCTESGQAYSDGVRYFSPGELARLFSPYPVTSGSRAPDFRKENWCYRRDRPLVTGFVEVTKPQA